MRASRYLSHRYYRLQCERERGRRECATIRINMLNNSLIHVKQVKLTAVHLIRTMLTRIGATAATAQWHAAVGARPLCGLHHLFVL